MKENNDKGTAVAKAKEKINKIEDKLDKTKEKISDNLSSVAEKVHEKSDTTQEYLSEKVESAEDILRKKTYEAGDATQQTIQKANELGHRAAEVIGNSSEYVKEIDLRETKESIKRTLKQRPEIGIALAGTFGLLLGLIIGGRKSNNWSIIRGGAERLEKARERGLSFPALSLMRIRVF